MERKERVLSSGRLEGPPGHSVDIKKLSTPEEALWCAELMAASEPWLTLKIHRDVLLKIMNDPWREVYVGYTGKQAVGVVIILMKGALTGYIQSICVAPQWRNKGIGRQLMNYAEKRIFSEAPNVFLFVSSFNGDAQRFYKKLGYEVVGELCDYFFRGESEILLRKSIAPLSEFKKAVSQRNRS
ncbi:MAG: N-acetyltransferase [Desulfosoma sp.]